MSLPFVKRVTVELEKGVLSIATNVLTETNDDGGEACGSDTGGDCCCSIRKERFTGASSRRIRLPVEVDEQTIAATLENGLLTITLARPVASGPRRIAIT